MDYSKFDDEHSEIVEMDERGYYLWFVCKNGNKYRATLDGSEVISADLRIEVSNGKSSIAYL